MPLTDAVLYVHGTGTTAYGAITLSAGVYGDALCAAGSQYSNLELDFGTGAGGGPVGFPSTTEKGYTFPPEVVGDGGVEFGLHIQVCQVFNTLTSILFNVVTAATTAATTPIIAARSLTLAQLAVAGAHYFIPVNFAAVLEFLRFDAVLTGSDPTTGTIIAWFGPKTGGEQ